MTTVLILRMPTGSLMERFDAENAIDKEDTQSFINLLLIMCPELDIEGLELISTPEAESIIAEYDDKILENELERDYRFGVMYQDVDQFDESEIFGNTSHSDLFENFIQTLGERVTTANGKTLIKTVIEGKSLTFHVSTLLPHSSSDNQQCQRKARIGNDVVSIVFQAEETVFSPEIITSQFLHVYIGRFSKLSKSTNKIFG